MHPKIQCYLGTFTTKPISMRQTTIATIATISTIPRQEIIRQRPNASFRQKRKEYPLQLEVEGLDQESLKINNITKIYHHNEIPYPVKYIIQDRNNNDNNVMIGLDPIKFEKQLNDRNISSINCIDQNQIHEPLPCDDVYLCRQDILELINIELKHKNNATFLDGHMKIFKERQRAQRDINIAINDPNINNQQARGRILQEWRRRTNQLKNEFKSKALAPMIDASIVEVIFEQGLKPMLNALHLNSLKYNQYTFKSIKDKNNSDNHKIKDTENSISNTTSSTIELIENDTMSSSDSEDDIPIGQRIQKEHDIELQRAINIIRNKRKNNISNKIRHRFNKGSFKMIHPNQQKDTDKENENIKQQIQSEQEKEQRQTQHEHEHEHEHQHEHKYKYNENIWKFNPFGPECERRLQLAAMLNIEADNYDSTDYDHSDDCSDDDDDDDDDDRPCWMRYIEKPLTINSIHDMADLPHKHLCHAHGINNCLLTEHISYSLPNKQEIKEINEIWKENHLREQNEISKASNIDRITIPDDDTTIADGLSVITASTHNNNNNNNYDNNNNNNNASIPLSNNPLPLKNGKPSHTNHSQRHHTQRHNVHRIRGTPNPSSYNPGYHSALKPKGSLLSTVKPKTSHVSPSSSSSSSSSINPNYRNTSHIESNSMRRMGTRQNMTPANYKPSSMFPSPNLSRTTARHGQTRNPYKYPQRNGQFPHKYSRSASLQSPNRQRQLISRRGNVAGKSITGKGRRGSTSFKSRRHSSKAHKITRRRGPLRTSELPRSKTNAVRSKYFQNRYSATSAKRPSSVYGTKKNRGRGNNMITHRRTSATHSSYPTSTPSHYYNTNSLSMQQSTQRLRARNNNSISNYARMRSQHNNSNTPLLHAAAAQSSPHPIYSQQRR